MPHPNPDDLDSAHVEHLEAGADNQRDLDHEALANEAVEPGGSYLRNVTMEVPLTMAGMIWVQGVLGMVPFGPDAIGHHALCYHCERPIIYVGDNAGSKFTEWEHATVTGQVQSHIPSPVEYATGGVIPAGTIAVIGERC